MTLLLAFADDKRELIYQSVAFLVVNREELEISPFVVVHQHREIPFAALSSGCVTLKIHLAATFRISKSGFLRAYTK